MYFGEGQTVLDEKNRITVASQFRKTMDVLGHAVWFMTRGFDRSVFLFHKEQWDRIREKAGTYSSMDSRAVDFRRMFFGSVAEAKPDGQGRVLIPDHLRAHAGLTDTNREAVLVGCDDHLELWSRDGWKQYQERMEEKYKEMGRELFSQAASGDSA